MSLPRPRSIALKLFGAVVTAFLAIAATAVAATPLNVGPAADTGVVVDESGTGYFTWADKTSPQTVHYCRLAQATTTCSASQTFSYSDSIGGTLDEGNEPMLASGGRILIADGRCCIPSHSDQRFVYSSTDGGTTFTPTAPGAGNTVAETANGLQGSVLFAPGGSLDPAITGDLLLGIADGAQTGGADFQAMPTAPPLVTANFPIDPDTSPSFVGTGSSTLGLQGSTLLAAYTDTDGKIFTRRYDNSGDPNDPANWSSPLFVDQSGPAVYNSELVTGGPGTGIYLVYSDASKDIILRRYDGSGWGTQVAMTGPGISFFSAAEDPSGVVHLAYIDTDGNFKYRYSRSAANNDFTNPQVLGDSSSNYFDSRLAVDSAGNGFVVWRDTDFNGKILPIAPGEGPGSGTTTPGDTTPLDPDTDIVLTVPSSCVPAGSDFSVSVALKKHKKHHRTAAAAQKKTKRKIKEADFYVGNVLHSKVKHKPFSATISTVGVTSPTLEVTAKVTVKVKRAGHKTKKVKKTLKYEVKIC
jgi:hypothetical protein